MCTCFAISHNGYPVAPVLPTSIALFFQSISVPGALWQALAITITRFRGTLSLPNNDYRQRLWHYDSRLPCGIVGTHTLTQLSSSRSLSESADNNHECIRFFLFGNFLILRRERFRQFYSHFANAQSIFANQTREIFFSSAVLCQDGRVPA